MNRSEELAKLLDLSPEYIVKYTIGDDNYFEQQVENPDVFIEDLEKRSPINGLYFKLIRIEKYYPDFTKPDNFVKLLENIKIDGNELCDWLICYSGSFCNRQDFIYRLIELIKEYTEVIGGLTQDIKTIRHQAQQTDWTY